MPNFSCARYGIHWEVMNPETQKRNILVDSEVIDNLEAPSNSEPPLPMELVCPSGAEEISLIFPENAIVITSSESDAHSSCPWIYNSSQISASPGYR